jgi:photosystem II stability/assembly factor-like uncharacterized protein
MIVSFGIGGCVCLAHTKATAQIETHWFDINPSTSPDYSNDDDASSGGRVNHLGASSDMRRVFAASEWGGLWTSFTQGLTWVKVNTFAPSATWDVKVDPRTTDKDMRVYVTSLFDGKINTIGTVRPGVRNSKSGISISNDGGNTWTNAPLPTLACTIPTAATEPSAWQIAIDPLDPDTVFVGTNCGLARTFNAGANWDYVDPSPSDNAEQVFTVLAQGNGLVDVITVNGHFRSINSGATWTAVPAGTGSFPGAGPATDLAVSPKENYVLFATNGGGGGNLFESDDGGVTWPTSLTVPTTTNRFGSSNVQGRITFVKTNQRANSSQFDLWYGDVQLFTETCTTPANPSQGGSSRAPKNGNWSNQAQGAHDDNGDLLFQPGQQSDACPLLFSSDGGIYRNQTANSPGCETANWGQLNVTPHATWVWAFQGVQETPSQHALYYGLQDDGNWGTQNANIGPPGNPVPSWNNDWCCDIFSNAAQSNLSFFVQGFYPPPAPRQFILQEANSDLSNVNQISNYPSAGTFNVFTNSNEVVPFGQNKFALSMSDGVYITNDITAGTISWTSLQAPTAPNSSTGGSLKISTVKGPTSIYYHTGAGTPTGPGQVFRTGLPTPAAGNTWNQLPLPSGITSVTVYDVDPNNGNNLIICGLDASLNFSMWSTKNFGANWNPLTNLDGLMLGSVFENNTTNGPTNFQSFGQYWQPFMVQIDPHDGNTAVVGAADAGIFITTDFGNNWKLITNPINPSSTAVHIARPIAAYFSPTSFTASSQAFNVWIATQGSGVQDVLVESP